MRLFEMLVSHLNNHHLDFAKHLQQQLNAVARDVQLAGLGEGGMEEVSLPFLPLFENRKKMPWFCKKSAMIWEKSVLSVYIYGLNSHLKCNF